MKDFFHTYVFQYLWLWFILGTVFGVYSNHQRIRKTLGGKPELAATAERLNWGFAFFGALPWVVMAIGIFSGQVQGVSDFFGVAHGIPFVRYWYLMMGCVFVLGSWWIYFGSGAESFAAVGRELLPKVTPAWVRWAWTGIVVWNIALGSGMYFDALGLK